MRETSRHGFAGVVLVLATFGCGGSETKDSPASSDCAKLCKDRLAKGDDLSNGPCLSDDLTGGVIAPNTVCDVAHNPRTDVDDDKANQCKAFHDGRASHFIEVNPACDFIRAR
jgi:hypothetical protein